MKKIVVLLIIMVISLSITSCEATNINDEVSTIETQATEQGDSTNSGGTPIEPTNDD